MDAELGHHILGVDQHVEQVRHRRALIAADIRHAGLQQRLGDREDAFAAEGLAFTQPQRLDLFLERTFHACLRSRWGPNHYSGLSLHARG